MKNARWKVQALVLTVAFAATYFAVPLVTGSDQIESRVVPAAGASTATASSSSAPVVAPRAASRNAVVKSVMAISIDGLNPDAITQLGEAGTPNLHRLMAEGAFTLNARSEYELTRTLPNHTGMLTSRPVAISAGGHGVTFNEDNGSTVRKTAGYRVKSVYTVVHKKLGRTALFATKPKFDFLNRSWDKSIDKYKMLEGNRALTKRVVKDLDRRGKFRMVHLSAPDVAGHAHGFMSEKYLAAVTKTDKKLGKIMRKIERVPRLQKNLLLLVTADHGGNGATHGEPTSPANYRVPFFAWGAGVTPADLYDLNPSYADPRNTRPGYGGKQPIRNGDVANLATDLLGLRSVPGSRFNVNQRLTVFAE